MNNLDFGLDRKDNRAGSKDSNSAPDSSLKWHETETFAKLREWVKTGPVAKAPDLLSQSYPAQGSSKIVMDPLSMTLTEDSRLVPQPKRKAAAGDLPLGTEDSINALQEDMDAMSQRLQRKLEALAEEATAVG